MEGYEFSSGITAAEKPWRAGVAWRACGVNSRRFYLTTLDARIFDSHGRVTKMRYGFRSLLERWADPEVPAEALGDLMALANGTFWDYDSKSIYGDLRGHRLDETYPGPLRTRNADLPGGLAPNVACRWWIGTRRTEAGVVTISHGRGTWRRECEDDKPGPEGSYEMLLGGGVLLHAPDLDVLALEEAEYKLRFNDRNDGFWRSESGEATRQRPFPGREEEALPANALNMGSPLARWAISVVGPNSVHLVSVGEGVDPESGMDVLGFARFVATTFGGQIVVMFDGSKPHAFAACPDVDALRGSPAVQHARAPPASEGGDSNSLCAVFRRVGGSILSLGEGSEEVPVARRTGDPDPATEVEAPEASFDPSDPPPAIAVRIEIRSLDDSVPQEVKLTDGGGQVIGIWGTDSIALDARGRYSATAQWTPTADPRVVEELVLEVRGGPTPPVILARHRVVVRWKRATGRIRVQAFGDRTRQVLEGVQLEGVSQEGTSQDRATSDIRGDAWLDLEVGPARVYGYDPRGRVQPADVGHGVRKAGTHLRLSLEEKLWEVRIPVIDRYTRDPIPTAMAEVSYYGRPVSEGVADAGGEVALDLPAAELAVEVSEQHDNYLPRVLNLLPATAPRTLDPVELSPVIDPGPSAVQGRVFFRHTLQDPKIPWGGGGLMVSKTYRFPDGTYEWREITRSKTDSGGRYRIDLPESSGPHALYFLRGGPFYWGETGFSTQRYELKELDDYVIIPDYFDP